MSSGSQYQWFIKPLDGKTNNALAELLAETGDIADNDTLRICDNQGKEHMVWRVEHEIVSRLEASRRQLGLRFRIFNRLGETGQVREWKFPARHWFSRNPAPVLRGRSQVKTGGSASGSM